MERPVIRWTGLIRSFRAEGSWRVTLGSEGLQPPPGRSEHKALPMLGRLCWGTQRSVPLWQPCQNGSSRAHLAALPSPPLLPTPAP